VPVAPNGNPLCVALDTPDYGRVERLAFITEPHAGMFKVGLMAFAANGPSLVRSLARMRPVFLDLKLHDIPAQVEGATSAVAGLGASWITVHAAGGPEMMRAAVEAAGDAVTVLAVTVQRRRRVSGVADGGARHRVRRRRFGVLSSRDSRRAG
jgi:orotidine-5'-phosphate decarboxylase